MEILEFDQAVERAAGKRFISNLRLELAADLEERYESIREAFLAVDKNRTGYIGMSEFETLFTLCNLDTQYVGQVFGQCDKSGNGKISFAEFARELTRDDYPNGTSITMTSPLTHQRPRPSPVRGKKTGAGSLKYTPNKSRFYGATTSRDEYKSWDPKDAYVSIIPPAQSVLFPLSEEERVEQELKKLQLTAEGKSRQIQENYFAKRAPKPSIRVAATRDSPIQNKRAAEHTVARQSPTQNKRLPKTNSLASITMWTGKTLQSMSFNAAKGEDPVKVAKRLCEVKNIDPNANVSTTIVEVLAGQIAKLSLESAVVGKEGNDSALVARLQTELSEATNMIKRLSVALKTLKEQNNRLSKSAKNRQSRQSSTPRKTSRSPVRKAVKIIIDKDGTKISDREGNAVGEEGPEIEVNAAEGPGMEEKEELVEEESPIEESSSKTEKGPTDPKETDDDDADADENGVLSNDFTLPKKKS